MRKCSPVRLSDGQSLYYYWIAQEGPWFSADLSSRALCLEICWDYCVANYAIMAVYLCFSPLENLTLFVYMKEDRNLENSSICLFIFITTLKGLTSLAICLHINSYPSRNETAFHCFKEYF